MEQQKEAQASPVASTLDTRTEWTCPMHPEIVRSEPGACPICGMALEPRETSLGEAPNHELADMTRRFWISLGFTIPIFALAMADLLPGRPVEKLLSPTVVVWIQLVLASPVVLWGGWPFFARGWASIINRHLNMFTLIALGTGAAYGYSVVAALFPGLLPASLRGHSGAVPVYFEAAAVITTLVLLGQVLELRARSRTGLATPMSILVGTGRGAQAGVLFKNAEALELLEKVDTIVVDKTGTLTEGKPTLVHVVPVDGGIPETDVLRLAAALESGSEHPLAAAVIAGARAKGLDAPAVGDFKSVSGKGVTGTVENHAVALGNAALFEELQISTATLAARAEELRLEGETVMFVTVDGKLAGILGVADPVKASAAEALKSLRADGLRVVMLTGDSETTARAVAKNLGIDEVIAGVLPEAKGHAVSRLQKAGRVVAMAGDGVNDAPALAQANVGIAMGTGTDVAIESAGVTLIKGDLGGIARARALSRATMRNIRQNLGLAFVYNALGVPLAAGVLYPWFGLLLSPMIASAAMSLSSVSVIGNALRLRREML